MSSPAETPQATFTSPPGPPNWLPFAWLNLARNPFGELTLRQRQAAAVVDVGRWAAWLRLPGARVLQFIGDSGRGKTTHLLALSQLEGACYVACPPSGPNPPLPKVPLLLVDEAERLTRRERRGLLNFSSKLVIGVHRDIGPSVARRDAIVRTVAVADQADPETIQRAMNRRLEIARLGDGPVPRLSLADGAALVQRFGNNIRAMESYLYENLQQHAGVGYGQVRFVD